MRLDRTFKDVSDAVRKLLHMADNNITAQENLGPSGAPVGEVLTSVGPQRVPQWQALDEAITGIVQNALDDGTITVPVTSVITTPGPGGGVGSPGPPGPPGDDFDSPFATMFLDPVVTMNGSDPEVTFAIDGSGHYTVALAWRPLP